MRIMDEKSLTQILAEGENQNQAFLVDVSDKWNTAVLMSSFANAKGGSVWIGVKPSGKIVGVYPEGILKELTGLVNRYFQKPQEFKSKVWKNKVHFVLEVIMERNPSEELLLVNDKNQTVLFERHGNKCVQASKIVMKNIQFKSQEKVLAEELSQDEKDVLDFIKNQGQVSLSQMYKHQGLEMSEIDLIVAQLVYRNLVELDFSTSVTVYRIASL